MNTPPTSFFRHPVVRWGLVLTGIWTLFGSISLLQYYLDFRTRGAPLEGPLILTRVIRWYNWVPLTGLLAALVRRYPFRRSHVLQDGIRYLGFGLLVTGIDAVLYAANSAAIGSFEWTGPFVGRVLFHFNRIFVADLLIVVSVTAVLQVMESHRASRARELRMAHLETRLVEAQLRALRMQLNPHFLFNTLNTISAIMDENVRAARRLMADLSDLLRCSLDNVREQLVPLEQEVDFVQRYLAIEQERLQERLCVRLDLAHETREALVPSLILQPLVENAVRHGIAPLASGGSIVLRARRCGEQLELQVEDDGAGLPGLAGGAPVPVEAVSTSGLGLAITRERLAYLYGGDQTLTLGPAPGRGLLVTLTLPFTTDVVEVLA